MTDRKLLVMVESTPKKAFASALDWPALCRSGRDEEAAVAALVESLPRYAPVARAAGETFEADGWTVEAVERLEGDATTAFGAPSRVAEADRRGTTAAQARRLVALLEASWDAFDRVAAAAPAGLRKGPRGGGRDTARLVAHVHGADEGYAGVLAVPPADRKTLEGRRRAVLAILGEASDGSPVADKRWPPRYATRRFAWHTLDHAWEIEDRTEPAG